MREDICSIPVSEMFEPRDGCPVCRMRDTAEERAVEYILGAAMMEPDVRIATNKMGFCHTHFGKMQRAGLKLPLALVIHSHLKEVLDKTLSGGGLFHPPAKKSAYKAARVTETCFVCDRMEWGMSRMIDTIYRLYNEQLDFRQLFSEQPMFCLPHYSLLIEGSSAALKGARLSEFQKTCKEICTGYLKSLTDDVQHFTEMFDYRNAGGDWGNSKDSTERAIQFLTGREAGGAG